MSDLDPKIVKRDARELLGLRIAAVLTIVALAMMVWSMLQPTPLPVMLAMSVGQGMGTMAFGLYLYIVIRTLRRERRQR